MPDIVGNLRYDQPWGAVQLSAAVRSSLFANTALGTPPTAYAFPAEVRRAVVGALGFSAVAQAAEAVASASAIVIGRSEVGHRAAGRDR